MDIEVIVFVLVLALSAGLVVMFYNRFVGLKNRVANAWKQIDVQLKRRHDLIPNLVEVVKDSMGYEQETLQQVIQARSAAMGAQGMGAVMDAEQRLSDAMLKLFAVMEAYPDLKANAQAAALMEELTSTENRIAFARQHYNDSVEALNTAVESFPGNLVAGAFGFRVAEYFAVAPAETAPVKVDLR